MVKVMKEGSDSSAPPVWVMPVFSGVTACFDSMLNSYDAPYRRTVYGLTDPYITGNEEALTASFDDWIGLYVAAIKTKQEQGPYTFMGYSQGKCNTRALHRPPAPSPAKRPRVRHACVNSTRDALMPYRHALGLCGGGGAAQDRGRH